MLRVSDKKLGKVVKKLFGLYFIDVQGKPNLHIMYLPDSKKIPGKFGIGDSGFTPVYKSPSNKSEIVTQILIGETCSILDISEDKAWLLIKLDHDGYIGYASSAGVRVINEKTLKKWRKAKRVTLLKKYIEIKDKASAESETLRIASIGIKLPLVQKKNGWNGLLLPDEKIGWVQKNAIGNLQDGKTGDIKKIINTAYKFLGSPYLWGGRTLAGIDCSGFVQTVFNLNGLMLPRDSGLQFKTGSDIGFDFKNYKAGDLLFFGKDNKQITHVGIFLGKDMDFIHSSGYVHISSLNPKSDIFDKRLNRMFLGARRVLNN